MNQVQDKRLNIIKQASNLFSHKGYYGVGINEILTSCQIPKGSFYHYFPNGKKQLAAEVLRYAYESMEEGILNSSFAISNDAVEVFSAMTEKLAQNLENKSSSFHSLLITFLGIESVYLDPEISQEATKVYIRWKQLYVDKFLECGYNETQAQEYSQVAFALVHGSLISGWVKSDPQDLLMIRSLLPKIIRKP